MCGAGHDEDPAKAAMGTPLERIMKMGAAMLEAVRAFKPPSSDGKKFEIRLGELRHHPSCTLCFRHKLKCLHLQLCRPTVAPSTCHACMRAIRQLSEELGESSGLHIHICNY